MKTAPLTLVLSVLFATNAHAQLVAGDDADSDGVLDSADNCLLVQNATQFDADNDGYGNACDMDLNNDGFVNFLDVSLFSAEFLSNSPVADANGDGIVNFLDLIVLREQFLSAPGPAGIIRWAGGTGDWFDQTNWLPTEVPSTFHHVVIDVPGEVVVTFSQPSTISVSSLFLGNTLDMCSQVMSVEYGVDLKGELIVTCDAVLSVASNIQLDGVLRLSNGLVENAVIENSALESGKLLIESATTGSLNDVTLGVDTDVSPDAELVLEGDTQFSGGTLALMSDVNSPARLHVKTGMGLFGNGTIEFQGPFDPEAMGIIDTPDSMPLLTIDDGISVVVTDSSYGFLGNSDVLQSTNVVSRGRIEVNFGATLMMGVDIYQNDLFGEIMCFPGGSLLTADSQGQGSSTLVNDSVFDSLNCDLTWPSIVQGNGSFFVDGGSLLLPYFDQDVLFSVSDSQILIAGSTNFQPEILEAIGGAQSTNSIELQTALDLQGESLDINGNAWTFSEPARFVNGTLSGTQVLLADGDQLKLESITLEFATLQVEAGATLSIYETLNLIQSEIELVLSSDCDSPASVRDATLEFFGGDSPFADTVTGTGEIRVYGGSLEGACSAALIDVSNNTNLMLDSQIDISVTGGELLIAPQNDGAFNLFGTAEVNGQDARLFVSDHVENKGTIRVLNGAELYVSGSTGPTNGFDNDGLIESINSSVFLTQGWRNTGTVSVTGGDALVANPSFDTFSFSGNFIFDEASVVLDFTLELSNDPFLEAFSFMNSTVDFIGTTTGNFSNNDPFDTSSLPDNFAFLTGITNAFNGTITGSQPVRLGGTSSFTNIELETDLILLPGSNTSFESVELVNSDIEAISFDSAAGTQNSTISLFSSITGTGTVTFVSSGTSAEGRVVTPFPGLSVEFGPDVTVQLSGTGDAEFDLDDGELDIKGPVIVNSGGSRLSFNSLTRLHNVLTIGDRGFVFTREDLAFVGPASGLNIEATLTNPGNAMFAFNSTSIDVSAATLSVFSNPLYIPEDCKEFDVLNYSTSSTVTQFAAFGNLDVGGKTLEIDYTLPEQTVLRVPGAACP